MDGYFKNVEKTLKEIAVINVCVSGLLGLLVWISMANMEFLGNSLHLGFPGFVIGLIIFGQGLFNSLLIYGFGSLIENTKEIKNNTYVLTLTEEKRKEIEQQERDRQISLKEKQAAEKAKQEEEKAKQEEERIKAEKEAQLRKEKIDSYWAEHKNEYDALLKKKTEVKEALKQLTTNTPEKEKLTVILSQIEAELNKER